MSKLLEKVSKLIKKFHEPVHCWRVSKLLRKFLKLFEWSWVRAKPNSSEAEFEQSSVLPEPCRYIIYLNRSGKTLDCSNSASLEFGFVLTQLHSNWAFARTRLHSNSALPQNWFHLNSVLFEFTQTQLCSN